MDSASAPSRSMISSAAASTASRVILPLPSAAGPPAARAVGVVMTGAPSPPGERMYAIILRRCRSTVLTLPYAGDLL